MNKRIWNQTAKIRATRNSLNRDHHHNTINRTVTEQKKGRNLHSKNNNNNDINMDMNMNINSNSNNNNNNSNNINMNGAGEQ